VKRVILFIAIALCAVLATGCNMNCPKGQHVGVLFYTMQPIKVGKLTIYESRPVYGCVKS
jgi:hypothetical protein